MKKHETENHLTSTIGVLKIQKRVNESQWEGYTHDEKSQLIISLDSNSEIKHDLFD